MTEPELWCAQARLDESADTGQRLAEMFRIERRGGKLLSIVALVVGREDAEQVVSALNEQTGDHYTMTRIDAYEIAMLVNDLLSHT